MGAGLTKSRGDGYHHSLVTLERVLPPPKPALRGSQAPHFGGLVFLLLTIHITNIQLNYYLFNQYFKCFQLKSTLEVI